ncbi:hypothetical protein [uncultured Selenomonas sp.]|uniref:hypothetical protein n=1 Tax=uncultured Selenomonas sp. TaxID=159275 RepID=UPI0028EBFE29|nr:hypothetical protein [uncultured Selenomonas sp.]
MTININLTGMDLAGAQKDAIANLICSLQALSASTGIKSEISASSEIGTEIDLPDVPHKTKSSETVIVPDKVYKDEPIPAKPKAKTKPAPAQAPEPETNSAEEVAAEEETPLLEEAAEDSTAAPAPNDAETDYKKLRETVKAECAAIARSGKSKALKTLLADRGVEKLSEISDAALEDFLKAARAL